MHKTLAVTTILATILVLALRVVVAEASGSSYAIMALGSLLEIAMDLKPADVWNLAEPITVSYDIEAEPAANTSSKSLTVFLELKFVSGKEVLSTWRLLGSLRVPGRLEGAAVILPPPGLASALKDGGLVTLIPVLVLSDGSTVEARQLAPLRLYVKPLEDVVMCGKCVVDLGRGLELCVAGRNVVNSLAPSYAVKVELRASKAIDLKAVVYAESGGALMASKTLKGRSNYFATELVLPLETLSSASRELTIGVKGLTADSALDLSVSWPLAISSPREPLIVRLLAPEGLLIEGEEYEVKVLVEPRVTVPLVVERVELLVNGNAVSSKVVALRVAPGNVLEIGVPVKLPSGKVNLTAVVYYFIAGRWGECSASTELKVEKALRIAVAHSSVQRRGEIVLLLTSLRELHHVDLIALKGNKSVVLTTLEHVNPLQMTRVVVEAPSEPGKYIIKAVTPDGLESNEVVVEVAGAENRTKRQPVRAGATPRASPTTKLSVALLPSELKARPGAQIELSVLLSRQVPGASIKVYRSEPRYSPPWVLVPDARASPVSGNEYKVSFKAPKEPGNYTYKVVVEADGLRGEALLRVRITEGGARPSSGVLPLELFVPVVCTAAAGSVLLYRRARRR